MKFGVGVDYSLKALIMLAERFPTAQPTRVEEIAETQGIPENYLRRLLIELKRGGLVASQKAPRGGPRLARAPTTTTLGKIYSALDGGVLFHTATLSSSETAKVSTGLRRVFRRAEAALREELANTLLSDIARKPARKRKTRK